MSEREAAARAVILRFCAQPLFAKKLKRLMQGKEEETATLSTGSGGHVSQLVNEMDEGFIIRFPDALMDAVLTLSPKDICEAVAFHERSASLGA